MVEITWWWVFAALMLCGIILSLTLCGYLVRRMQALTRTLNAPNAKEGIGCSIASLLLTVTRIEATLDDLRESRVPGVADAPTMDRYRLGRDLAASGATAEAITEACGITACEAELLRTIHGGSSEAVNATLASSEAAETVATAPASSAAAGHTKRTASRRKRRRKAAAITKEA